MPNLKKNATPVWSHLRWINRILPYSVLPLTFMLCVIQSHFIFNQLDKSMQAYKVQNQFNRFLQDFYHTEFKICVCNTLTNWTAECNTLLMQVKNMILHQLQMNINFQHSTLQMYDKVTLIQHREHLRKHQDNFKAFKNYFIYYSDVKFHV